MDADPGCGFKGGRLGAVAGINQNRHATDRSAEAAPSASSTSPPIRVDLSSGLIPVLSTQTADFEFCDTTGIDLLSSDDVSALDGSTSLRQMTPRGCNLLPQKTEDTTGQGNACVEQLCEIMVNILYQTPNSFDFGKLKKHFYDKVKELVDKHQIEAKRSGDKMSSLRMKMLEDRLRLRSIEKGLHENYSSDVKGKANELLDRRSKEVYNENLELVREKVLLANDVKLARDREHALGEENTALRRAVDVNTSIESDLKEKCVQYKKEIVKLKEQIKSVEDSMEKVSGDYEARLVRQNAQHAKQIKALTKERDSARCDALQLNAELIKLRKASAQVLSQRGELENFFYEALNEVKAQVVYERQQQLLTTHTKSISERGTAPQGSINPSRHTHSSALRIENQRFLQLMGCSRTHPTSSPPSHPTREYGDGVCGRTDDPSAVPAAQGKSRLRSPAESSTGVKALPPIPHGATSGSSQDPLSQLCLLEKVEAAWVHPPPGPQGGGGSSCQERSEFAKADALPSGSGGATWKMIHQVDVSKLSWPDKERVLLLLFERIRAQRQRLARKALLQSNQKMNSDAAKDETMDHPTSRDENMPKSTLFITET
ncbi:unnamed protein product [Phytomonas sp. EM1]|nr:unnamed protein product [Phytomonas sp. EM1]|eukprot:CCW63273.1 unnamed protein product [Phytomonas sp. isolate EM1]